MGLETLSEHRCFGGVQGFYRHNSAEIGLPRKHLPSRPARNAWRPSSA